MNKLIFNTLRAIKHKILPVSYYSKRQAMVDYRWYNSRNNKTFRFIKSNKKIRPRKDYCEQFELLVNSIIIDYSGNFVYPYDPLCVRLNRMDKTNLASITVDYDVVLDSSLSRLEEQISNCTDANFKIVELSIIQSLRNLRQRIIRELDSRSDDRSRILKLHFVHMLDEKPLCFEEALQKILFYNACFWQMRHKHNGLGRLGMILEEYYKNDIKKGVITREYAKSLIRDFCILLNKDMLAKSLGLPGDTGQYILLSGIDRNGSNVESEVDELFLEVIREIKTPDPKLVLRANKNTSDSIWDKSIECILSGNGSPLIMNEDRVIKGMKDFGYSSSDTYNVGISACWEPLIIGKSFDQNNSLKNVSLVESINEVIFSPVEFANFDELFAAILSNIRLSIKKCVKDLDFDCSPLYTLFFDDCINKEKDFAEGGSKYSYHGVEVVGLPNAVNALLNIKDYVFEKQYYTLSEIRAALKANFVGFDELKTLCLNNNERFGNNIDSVKYLTLSIMRSVGDCVNKLSVNGERLKVGFSSSAYLNQENIREASIDGRLIGDPLATHISPTSHKIDIKEIFDFASELDYSGNRLNGNVVDFIIPTAFVQKPEKLKTILKAAVAKGVYELQLNVLDAATLKDAKANPEKYPNLIVRVWGFSAYFNDLPEEYKDNLIRRAELYNK